jgi:chloramphenicol 3-O-phosphotransferase
MGVVIILTGIGSVGKSSVANALKNKFAKDLDFSIEGFDTAVEKKLEKQYWPEGSNSKEGFYYVETASGPEMQHGEKGKKFLEEMISDIIKLANSGKNIIIDSVLSDAEHNRLIKEMKDCTILQVGLKPPLQVVIDREQARPDRKVGVAKAAYDYFYACKTFDVEIDTSKNNPDQAAAIIEQAIREKQSQHTTVNTIRP